MDDCEAIRRMMKGELSGLEALVERYQVKALRVAFLVTHDEALAEDVVQDTFIRLYQGIRHFDITRPLEPYLMRGVVNAALNSVRRDGKYTSLDADPAQVENLLEQSASVEAQVEVAQRAQEILEALSTLTPRQRAVIVLRYYLDLSEREMVQALDAAPGTIKWLLHAARSRLRQLIGLGRSTE